MSGSARAAAGQRLERITNPFAPGKSASLRPRVWHALHWKRETSATASRASVNYAVFESETSFLKLDYAKLEGATSCALPEK